MRDIVLEETIYMDFTTRAFASGVPTVLAGTPVLSVLEENNATPITSGVSVSVDRASVVGLNMATIVATGANGYEAGKGYSVYISTGTVGGVSVVGEKVGEFTIGASAAAQDLANGTDGLGAIKADTAAILTDTADIQPNYATSSALATVDGIVDNILLDTAEIGTAGAGLTNINLPNQTMDITGNITGNLSGSVGSLTGHTVQTGDTYALANGSAGFVAIDTVVDSILVDTAEIGTAGAGLTDLGGMSTAMKAEILVEVNAAFDTAISELSVAAPTATPTVRTGLMLMYMALRNKLVVQTSGTDALEVYNNAGTKIASKLITDDGSDYTEAEMS